MSLIKVGEQPREIRSVWRAAFFALAVMYMELVVRLFTNNSFASEALRFTALFSLAAGVLGGIICSLFGEKGNKLAAKLLAVALFLIYGLQTVYYGIFKTYFTLCSMGGAGEVSQYWREALEGILRRLPAVLLLAVPAALLLVFSRRYVLPRTPLKTIGVWALIFASLHIAAAASVSLSADGVYPARDVYRGDYIPELAIKDFGVLTGYRLDLRQLFFGSRSEQESYSEEQEPDIDADQSPEETFDDNVLDIDFAGLAESEQNSTRAALDQYFSACTPSQKNEYTGMFEGKNLIWITAEGFSSWALDEQKTPTLYKLAHSGFVMENFYNPIWGVSTSDGEYVPLMSLLPKAGVWSFRASSHNSLPFVAGNSLLRLGYSCYAYHDHSYTYYGRNQSHPNLGYIYKGVGNGLSLKTTWPESDLEMMQKTVDEYIGSEPFHVYYMTVSGHLNYTFNGNAMASKHKQDVADLPYSEEGRAYIACQMEFDQALEYLIERLDEAGELDDTLFVITGDHYPYGLSQSGIDELAGHSVDTSFELYHSTCIIWNSAMEQPVYVDKNCSTLDVLPTVLNLMGVDFDSRLLMGRDILSDSPALVIFNNRSWLTDLGRYDAKTDVFTPADGAEIPDGYAARIMTQVKKKFEVSARILDSDYYACLGLE